MILGHTAVRAVYVMVWTARRDAEESLPVMKAWLRQPFERVILQRLRAAGLVGSLKGPGGGYFLSRPPEGIRLDEIIDAVCQDLDFLYSNHPKLEGLEGLPALLGDCNDAARKPFEAVTLADLLKEGNSCSASSAG